MGNKKKSSGSAGSPSVSIITVTQYSRRESLKVLKELIQEQVYQNIIEWVIVEGSTTHQDSLANRLEIDNLIADSKIKINYIVPPDGSKLGAMRNIGNNACIGDITVCMDDDDYYPPTRVSHAVEKLMSSKCLIAGCTHKRMYDYTLDKFYGFGDKFGINHSTNDCMAWKKEYILTNSHDPEKSMAEEASFTKQFTNPMVQLNTVHVHVGTIHSGNTFDKRQMCIQGSLGMHMNMFEIKDHIGVYVPKKHLKRFKELYSKPKQESSYDIVYYTGVTSIQWDPSSGSLGGSEQAVVNLSNEWARAGKRVAVYGLVPEKRLNGVDYFNAFSFPYEHIFNVLVIWRMSGLRGIERFHVKTKFKLLDLHDTFYPRYQEITESYDSQIDKYMFKSKFHLESFERVTKIKLSPERYSIILNGIRLEKFSTPPVPRPTREPFRFCYCSCYTRGLENLLRYTWPYIFRYQPLAELHVYYGMKDVEETERNRILGLLCQPGVMDHSRQPMELIINEKWRSTFHLYITNADCEIDCISVRESIACGCIPIISDFGVFKERNGIHFKMPIELGGDTKSGDQKLIEQTYNGYTEQIVNLMHNHPLVEGYRSGLKAKEQFLDWKSVAAEWTKLTNQ